MSQSNEFKLDPRLERDCFVLGKLKSSQLLLLNNSLVPWFILVPETTHTELFELENAQQVGLLGEINIISQHLKQNFHVDKLNVATIGNIVSQLHIHIVGRHINDFCWPNTVWGADKKQTYSDDDVEIIKSQLKQQLADVFHQL